MNEEGNDYEYEDMNADDGQTHENENFEDLSDNLKLAKKKITSLANDKPQNKSLKTKTNNILLLDLICEYVEVYIHCILYKTKLYKKSLFDKFQKYNIIVYRCNNDLICSYIEKCIECLRVLLNNDFNQCIAFAILDKNEKLFKRFTIQVSKLIQNLNKDEFNELTVEAKLRDSLLKLLYSSIEKLDPTTCKWQIQLKSSAPTLLNPTNDLFKIFSWRICDRNEYAIENSKIKPIKSIHSDEFQIQTYVESQK